MTAQVWDSRPCLLGEGALWHPERGALFWFDILAGRLLWRAGDDAGALDMGEMVSAAGWISARELLVASETALLCLDVETGRRETLAPLEADEPGTRSNDGRADPWGGFWIGTMGKRAEPGAGAIYRYHRGELRRLYAPLTIPNALCFSPDGAFAYLTDTPTQIVHRVALAPTDGWPAADPEPWLDLSRTGWRPDGAVVDAAGNLWNAQWGGARVACYAPDGRFVAAIAVPAAHSSCPAFGGPDLATLYCTTAREGLSERQVTEMPLNGMTFAARGVAIGQAEHRVLP